MSIVLRSLESDRKAMYIISNINNQVNLQFKHFYSAVLKLSVDDLFLLQKAAKYSQTKI